MALNAAASFVVAFCLGAISGSIALGQAPQAAVRFEQIEEVISGFEESQHLYVQGEIGISDEQFAALETWLDTHGPHWTIVLMQRGANQVYTAPDGRTFTDLDAVEFALGHGLANRTQFGRLEHPKTGETDGAAFVLFLEDRKFSYYASDAQDRRGIGEAQWIGTLDRNARVAMQNGGRIIDAVKDTVTDINNRLAQSLADEERAERERIAQAERIKRERERAVVQVRSEVEEARTKLLPETQSLADTFLKNFPEANASAMARPPVSDWKSQLDKAESGLTEDNSRETSQTVSSIVADIHRHLDYYGAHTAFEQTVAPLQQRWQGLTLHRFSSEAESHALAAQQLLRRARTEHLAGNPAFIATLDGVRKELDLGDQSIYAAVQKLEQDLARKQVIRRTILTTLSIVFVASALLLLFLHRRRRPALAAALQLLSANRQQFQKEQASIEALATRKQAIIGTADQFAKRGKTGETLVLAQGIETACSGLQSMMSTATEVFSKADGLINPASLGKQIVNLISPTRFLEARNLLISKAFKFLSPASDGLGLEPSLESSGITFDDFLTAIAKRREATNASLSELESCTQVASPTLDRVDKQSVTLEQQMRSLIAEAKKDSYFAIPDLEAKLLPSIRRLIDRGRKMREIDPVNVVKSICPEASRQIVDAMESISLVNNVRSQQFPVFDEMGDKLKALNHRVQWIEEHVVAMGERLNQLMSVACDQDVTSMLKQVKTDSDAFLTKLHGIVQTAETTIAERLRDVEETRRSLAEARTTVAKSLSIAVTDAITEESLNPDDHLISAEAAINASRIAIDMGNLDDAIRTAEAAEDETRYAQGLIDDSLLSLREFALHYSPAQMTLDKVTTSLADVSQTVATAEKRYAPTALIWHDEPEASTEANDSRNVAQNSHDDLEDAWESEPFADGEPVAVQVESAKRIIESIRAGLATAPGKHAAGKLLDVANILRFAKEGITESNKRLALANTHCKRVDALVPANVRRAESLMAEVEKLREHVEDARAETSTQQIHEQLRTTLKQLTHELKIDRVGRDPFEDTKQLLQQRIAIVELRSLIKADFTAFEEAKRAVEGARRELKAVARLAMQSIEDQVPDSEEIARCQDEIRRLSPVVTAAEEALKVAHNDWQAIQKSGSDATAELGIVSGSLSQELRSAQEAALGLKTAASEVLRASRWTGAYGITVSGEPGSYELEEARNALASGDYTTTVSFSARAVNAAVSAINAAEEAVTVRRRREAEIAAARRRSREESLFSSSSGSSFGSSRSSWSSSSSSRSSFSSSSSSSSRSSGGSSGFSRSGW
jgi:hypothetical protein